MQSCFLTIVTSVDGKENTLSLDAEMELSPLSAVLRYRQGEGQICLRLREGCFFVERQGDYVLRFRFIEGETLSGSLGLPGAEGEVEVTTRRLGWSIGKNSFLLLLDYSLGFVGGTQEMKLRLNARSKDILREQ